MTHFKHLDRVLGEGATPEELLQRVREAFIKGFNGSTKFLLNAATDQHRDAGYLASHSHTDGEVAFDLYRRGKLPSVCTPKYVIQAYRAATGG